MARKRAPYVAVRTDVIKDESYAVLGDIGGYNRHEALGRMFALWAFCRDRGLEDAPASSRGYVVRDAVVRRFLGARGVEAILADGCDEFSLGERIGDGLIYLRGTSDTVAALRAHAASAAAGGEARSCGNRDTVGRFSGEESVSQTTIVQPNGTQTPATTPPDSSVPPSSFLLRSPSEKNDSQSSRTVAPAARIQGHWTSRYKAKHGRRPTWSPSRRLDAERLEKQHGADDVCRAIDIAHDAPPHFLRGVIDWDSFVKHFDKFVEGGTGPPSMQNANNTIRPTRLL